MQQTTDFLQLLPPMFNDPNVMVRLVGGMANKKNPVTVMLKSSTKKRCRKARLDETRHKVHDGGVQEGIAVLWYMHEEISSLQRELLALANRLPTSEKRHHNQKSDDSRNTFTGAIACMAISFALWTRNLCRRNSKYFASNIRLAS